MLNQNYEVMSEELFLKQVNPALREYVEAEILPLHDGFDAGHRRDHIRNVIASALKIAVCYDVSHDMVFAAAAFHDTGLREGRERHHEVSARIVREDLRLRDFFTEEQIDTIAWAAYDHRASSSQEPRSIYGKIIAEADRQISAENVMLRTVQYGLKNYPQLDKEGHWRRAVDHMHEKYDYGGYLKLWIPESDNAVQLERLRRIIANEKQLRQLFDQSWALSSAE